MGGGSDDPDQSPDADSDDSRFPQNIDGLKGVCENVMQVDPFLGYVLVFRNRRNAVLKTLIYDFNGFRKPAPSRGTWGAFS